MMPMMSLSFMMRRSSPSIFTSVPDHLPNSLTGLFVNGARASGDDLAFLRLFLSGLGDDDAAGGLGIFFDAADDHAVAKGTELHACLS
jgi:hypothetical protein